MVIAGQTLLSLLLFLVLHPPVPASCNSATSAHSWQLQKKALIYESQVGDTDELWAAEGKRNVDTPVILVSYNFYWKSFSDNRCQVPIWQSLMTHRKVITISGLWNSENSRIFRKRFDHLSCFKLHWIVHDRQTSGHTITFISILHHSIIFLKIIYQGEIYII